MEISEFEKQARISADTVIQYLLEHQYLQMSNRRDLQPERLPSLDGVQQMILNSRSAVSLYSRDAVVGDAFWGYTIDITVKEQLIYEEEV
jgi:hypothetical protein